MTIDEIADKLKKNEIDYDEEYLKAILHEEKAAEQEIEYLLLLLWAGKIKKREFYNETNRIIEELFSEIEEDMSVELEKRHQEGYTEGAFLVQLLLGSFSPISYSSKYNPKWHMNNGSFLDDLLYYKNRLIDDIRKEVERLRALKAPVESAISGITKPFKKLSNSTKAMVDTEMVYAERQGLKSAYMDHDARKYRYLATLDGLTCERCAELDGKVFLLSEAVAGANYPPMHPFCRCTTIPVFSDFDTTKRYAKDENGEAIEVSMTYDEWKKEYANVLKEDSGNAVVNKISQKNIDNIKLPDIPGLSEEQKDKLTTKHKELLTFAKDNNASMEVAMLLDDELNTIGDIIVGKETEVDLYVPGRGKAKFVLHNHPNNNTFSTKDISFVAKNEHTQYFSVIKNSGDVEILYKHNSFDKGKAKVEIKRLEEKFKKDIANNEQKGYTKLVEVFLTKTKSGLEYIR